MLLTVVFLSLGVFIIVLQTTVLQLLPGAIVRPDLAYLLVVYAAYRLPWIPGIVVAFSVGWVLDVVGGIELGIYPLQFLFIFICLKLITLNSPLKEGAYQIPMAGVSYVLLQMVVYFFSSLTFEADLPAWSWVGIIQETLLLMLAAIPCFLLFNSLYEYLQNMVHRSRPARRAVRKRY